ncbi:MAG: glycosyltransferase family 2 protein [Acidiferrobacterales bacterium]|nr:glycosyltransferase family 2 protein [Acidiferrobacterales bacterium]
MEVTLKYPKSLHPETKNTFVVIPHYGSDDMLDQCLKGLYQNPGIGEENTVIVNNNEQNRMFTRGVNVGIQKAIEKGAHYIWILNNDTVPDADYLESSLTRFHLSPDCGLVGGKNLRMDDPDQIFWGGSGRSFPSGRCKMGRVSKGDLVNATRENWGPFSSVIFDTRVVPLIGLLDEQFLMICSDSDYCFRIRMAGFSVWYEPKSVVLHHLGASNKTRVDSQTPMRKILQTDQKRFFVKWSSITGCKDPQELDRAINAYIARPRY